MYWYTYVWIGISICFAFFFIEEAFRRKRRIYRRDPNFIQSGQVHNQHPNATIPAASYPHHIYTVPAVPQYQMPIPVYGRQETTGQWQIPVDLPPKYEDLVKDSQMQNNNSQNNSHVVRM